MKKSVLAVMLAVALVSPIFATTVTKQTIDTQTEQTKKSKINFYGLLDVYGYQTDGYLCSGYSGGYSDSDTLMRVLLGINLDLTENIEGNFALLYGRYWGDTETDGTTGNGFLDIVRIAEANVVFNNILDNDKLSLKAGRYFWGEEGATMFYFGLKDGSFYAPWSMYEGEDAGIDGLLLTYDDKEKLKINAGYAKLDTEKNSSNESKASLFFAESNYKFSDKFILKGYYYDYESYTDDPGPYKYKQENIGLKPQANLLDNKLKMSVEFVQQFWDKYKNSRRFQNYAECWFAKADAKYNILDNLDIRGMYLRSGKDFDTYCGENYYYTSDIYLGLRGDNLYGDMEVLNIGLDYILNKFEFIADYFRTLKTVSSSYYPSYEIDAQIKYNYTKDISFKLAVGYDGNEYDGNAVTVYVFGATWKFDTRK